MQRVRAGLTGLAAIFLMVLIAAAGLKPNRSVAPAGTHGETLAVLGVAPGSAQEAERKAIAERRATARPVKRQPDNT